MRFLPIFCLCLIIIQGCVTLPDPVDEAYLKDISNEDSEKLEKLERAIITITNEKDELKKKLKKVSQQKVIAEKELEHTESENSLLQEKYKMYTENKDDASAAETKKQLETNETKLKIAKAKKDYFTAREKNTQAKLDAKVVELAYKVGEHRYEQAKIARAKQEELYGKETKDSEIKMIELKDYMEYYESQKKDFESKMKQQAELEKAESKAKKNLINSGYSGSLD